MSRTVLFGVTGTMPPDSAVWFKRSTDLSMFGVAVVEILNLLEAKKAAGPRGPMLSRVAGRHQRPIRDRPIGLDDRRSGLAHGLG